MTNADELLLDDLLERWEDFAERGEPDLEPLCGERLDLLPHLTRRVAALRASSWMAADPVADGGSGAAPPLTGTLAGRYRIEGLLGEGGHGSVYRAFDEELRRSVAVKVAATGRGTPDLLEEARRVAVLRHAGIVAVHDAGRHGDALFVVSDLVEGRTLAELLEDGPLPPREASRLMASVADALHHAHERGFVHRDVKPSNVLLDATGDPHVTDFGVAAAADDLTSGRAVTGGTLAYAAPEQVAGERHLVDRRADVYSLGVVLHEVLVGSHPFPSEDPVSLREWVLYRPPAPLPEHVPPHVADLCRRCFAKHPHDRPGTAAEVAAELREPPAASARRWRPAAAVAAGAVGLAAAFWLGTVVPERPPTPEDGFAADGVLHFDGRTRLVSNVPRELPVTLEAWVRPYAYDHTTCQWVIGSDVPTKYGVSLGQCPTLAGEHSAGMVRADALVPVASWSHVAGVFTESETRLYLDGSPVASGPGGPLDGSTVFVIGNVGRRNPIDYYRGEVRAARVTRGERYDGRFAPAETLADDTETLLLLNAERMSGGTLTNAAGRPVGTLERFGDR